MGWSLGSLLRLSIGIGLIAWLVVGFVAAAQRGYFGEDVAVTCTTSADTALTVLAGPLNWAGVNPRVTCSADMPG